MKTDFFLTQYDSFIHSLTLFILGDDEVFPPFEAVDDVFISENPRFRNESFERRQQCD